MTAVPALTEPFSVSVRRGRPLVWATGSGPSRTATLGWGEAFRATARGPHRFAELAAGFRGFAAGLDANPRAFVTVSFAEDSAEESVLIVPALLGTWTDGVLTVAANVPGADDALPEPEAPRELEDLSLLPGQLTRQAFKRAVAEATRRIAAGEVEKVVLARDLLAEGPTPMDVAALLTRLHEANPSAWTFQVDGLVGASPEMLVAVRGRRVRSQALAGSAPVIGDPTTDDATAERLASSERLVAEHTFAARSVAERLATIAEVTVSEPHVLRLPRIMHLATDISGEFAAPTSALDAVAVVHPSAAVCGTPTCDAARLLAELEGYDRGRYAGPVGWVDASGDGEFAIALRCGQLAPDARSIRLFAGGGIVAGSDPDTELAETARKFLAMYEALAPVERL